MKAGYFSWKKIFSEISVLGRCKIVDVVQSWMTVILPTFNSVAEMVAESGDFLRQAFTKRKTDKILKLNEDGMKISQ